MPTEDNHNSRTSAPLRRAQKSQKTNLRGLKSLKPAAHVSFPVLTKLREPGATTAILDGLNGARTDFDARSHMHLRKELSICYHVALLLQQDAKAWKAFCEDEWQNKSRRPRISKPERALHFTLKRYVGSGAGASKKASYYKKCLASSFAAKIPAHVLYSRIEGGIANLIEKASVKERQAIKQPNEFSMKVELNSRVQLYTTVVAAESSQRLVLSAGAATKAKYFIVAKPYRGDAKGGTVIKDALSRFLDDPRKFAGLKQKASQ